MFDTVFGLPTHALVVHAVVVLLPLAAIGGLLVAVLPRLRDRYGALVALLSVAVVPTVFVAQRSGEQLETRVNASLGPGPESAREAELMADHTAIADNLLPWAIVLMIGVLVTVGTGWLSRQERGPAWTRPAGWVGLAVVIAGAAASLYWVIRIGDAGARAAWSDLVSRAAL